jgi:hypothetical protein
VYEVALVVCAIESNPIDDTFALIIDKKQFTR